MATSQGIRAGRAFVELFADDTRLVRGLKVAQQRLQAFGAGVKSLGLRMFAAGAGLITPITAAANLFASMGSELSDMSQRTGVSVEALSELGYAAQVSGADLETLEGGLRKMQKFLVSAASGSQSAQEALSHLNLTMEQLSQLSPEDQFSLLADRLSQVRNPTARAALAMEVFGKTGTALLPMISGGAQGLAELRTEAQKLGLTIATEDAQAAEAFGDQLDTLWKVLKQGAFQIGAAVVPILSELAQTAIQVIVAFTRWMEQNRGLIVTIFQIGVAIAGAGVTLVTLGVILSGVGTACGMAATLITGIGTVIGVVGSVIGFLLSPIGLVSVAVVGLAGYLLYTSGVGRQALDWLAATFLELQADATAAWQGIRDALVAGDFALAAKILWLGLRLQWQKGISLLEDYWASFKEFFLNLASQAFYGATSLLIDAWAGLQSVWIDTTAFLADAWANFTGGLVTGWRTAQNFISHGVLRLMKLFDQSLDVEAAAKDLEQQFQQSQSASQQQRQRSRQEREQTRRQQQTDVEQQRQSSQGEVEQMAQSDRANRSQQRSAAQQSSEAALQQARKEFDEALADAARQKRELDEKGPGGKLKQTRQRFQGMDDLLEQFGKEKLSVQGTFNALAVRGLGGGDAGERTAKATEDTARNTKKLLDRARQGGPVFT